MQELNDDKELDKLFGTLKDFESDPDPALWSEIQASLPKNSFLNWSSGHFNVYYASAFAGLLVLASVLFFRPEQEIPDTNKQTLDTINVLPQQDTMAVIHPDEPVKASSQVSNRLKGDDMLVSVQDSNKPLLAESPDTFAKVVAQPDTTQKKIKEKKIVKIVHRDTLRVRDSIGIKRKRWQK